MSPVPLTSTVDTVTVRLPAGLSPGERAAWGRRAARSLQAVELDPPGLPPAAVLVVRRLSDPLPRALFVGEPWQAAATWGEAARAALGRQWQSAGRPARGPIGSDATAVWFADPAEWLACLSLDLKRGHAADRWWWRSWLKHGPATTGLATLWTTEARWLPAALALLAERPGDEAAEVVEALAEPETVAVRRGLVQAHRLPPALAESPLDRERLHDAVSYLAPILPARRAPAELLALALLVHHAPARARDRQLVTARQEPGPGPADDPSAGVGAAMTAPPITELRTAPSTDQPRSPNAAQTPPHAEPGATGAAARREQSQLPVDEAGGSGSAPSWQDGLGAHSGWVPAPPSAPETRPGTEEPPAPDMDGRADTPAAEHAPSTPRGDEMRAVENASRPALDEAGVETGLGGIWYLVNLMLALGLLDDEGAEPIDAWKLLHDLSAALLQGEPPDPVWAILDDLRGPHRPGCPHPPAPSPTYHGPLRGAHHPYHGAPPFGRPRGIGCADVPRSPRPYRGRGGDHRRVAWCSPPPRTGEGLGVGDTSGAARAWLAAAGFEDHEIPGLLGHTARLFVTRTHVDLTFRLEQIDLKARLAGLDRDPGWVPSLGRVISFHFR
jgi:hypothetical protein